MFPLINIYVPKNAGYRRVSNYDNPRGQCCKGKNQETVNINNVFCYKCSVILTRPAKNIEMHNFISSNRYISRRNRMEKYVIAREQKTEHFHTNRYIF